MSLIELSSSSGFWLSCLYTFIRVFLAFKLAVSVGFILGFLSADYPLVKDLLIFPLTVIRTVPVIAFILIALFWFQSDFVPVFVAFIMALPLMISAAEKGFTKDKEICEKLFKAECSGFTGFRAFRYIRLPHASASLKSGIESSFGLCWKVVAAAEVISIPQNALGSIMQKSQVHLETAEVLASTFVLVILSLIFQKILTKICLSSILYKSV